MLTRFKLLINGKRRLVLLNNYDHLLDFLKFPCETHQLASFKWAGLKLKEPESVNSRMRCDNLKMTYKKYLKKLAKEYKAKGQIQQAQAIKQTAKLLK